MTRQKTFKRRVRERMAKTGESYTAARRMLIAHGRSARRPRPRSSSRRSPTRRVAEATGRGWQAWFGCSTSGARRRRTHTEIARWLREEHAVDGWYSQSITVGYERARGLRAPGEHADGFAITASRTIAVPVERLFEAFDDEDAARALAAGRGAARAHGDGAEVRPLRLGGRLDPRHRRVRRPAASAKSRVALSHERLPDADTADEMKAFWRERLTALKAAARGR